MLILVTQRKKFGCKFPRQASEGRPKQLFCPRTWGQGAVTIPLSTEVSHV